MGCSTTRPRTKLWPRANDRPRRVPRPLPDPRDLHVPDQPLARGDARRSRGQSARVRAHVARARHPRVGRGLVGDAGHGRRPARPDPRRAARLDRDAPERDRRRGGRPLVLPQPGARNRIVYEEANFPSVRYLYQAQPELEVVAVEDDAAIVDAIDERTLLVPISHVLFKNGEIQDVEPIVRRAHEVGAHVVLDCYQSAGVVPFDLTGARRRLRRRRQRQVALRRAGRRLALRPAGPRGAARADARRLAGARAAVRVRAGARVRGRRAPLPHRHAERAGALRGDRRLRRDRGGRRRADPRALARAHAAPDRPAATRPGFEVVSPREPDRRGGTVTVSTPDHAAVPPRARRARDHLRLPSRSAGGIRLGPHFFNTEDEVRHARLRAGGHRRERRLRAAPRRGHTFLRDICHQSRADAGCCAACPCGDRDHRRQRAQRGVGRRPHDAGDCRRVRVRHDL